MPLSKEQNDDNLIAATTPYREQIFFGGDEYFGSMLRDIAAAKYSIDLEAYIFEFDILGKEILQALITAAQKGVKVRVLVDGAGSPQWGGELVRELERYGGQTRIFHPCPWRLWQWSRSFVRASSILKLIYLLLKINSRNHRKSCLIDQKVAYVGSFNITKNHLNKEGNGWRDTGVRLEGAGLKELLTVFDATWHHLPIQERLRQTFRQIYTNPIFRCNHTRHRRRILYKNLLHRLRHCGKRIWITNAYFVPDNFLLKRLQEAAGRGVDVRVLLPKKSDVIFMPWASKTFYENLLKTGVRIYEYLPAVLHAKTLILDDWMLIGSSNLNHRSLLHDLEIDINVRSALSKVLLEKQFLRDLNAAKEITFATWSKPPLFQRFIGRALLYLKYVI